METMETMVVLKPMGYKHKYPFKHFSMFVKCCQNYRDSDKLSKTLKYHRNYFFSGIQRTYFSKHMVTRTVRDFIIQCLHVMFCAVHTRVVDDKLDI